MTTQEILTTLQADIHSTVFATLDTHGLPQTCVIDLMLADAAGLYFLTVRGKAFYTDVYKRQVYAPINNLVKPQGKRQGYTALALCSFCCFPPVVPHRPLFPVYTPLSSRCLLYTSRCV